MHASWVLAAAPATSAGSWPEPATEPWGSTWPRVCWPTLAPVHRCFAPTGCGCPFAAQRIAVRSGSGRNATGLFDLYRPGSGFVVVQGGHGLAAEGDGQDIDVDAGPAHVQRAAALVQAALTGAGPDAVAAGVLPFEG